MGAKAAVHAQPQKNFAVQASNENERWEWYLKQYEEKNKEVDKNNHYDWSRRELDFEIIDGEVSELGKQKKRLHERLQERLDQLGFKGYKGDATNNPNCCVDWVFSGDHDRMCEMAFGNGYKSIDYTAESDNSEAIKNTDIYKFFFPKEEDKKVEEPDIVKWAKETYEFVCKKWGKENVIGMEVHLDETTPHAHILMVPVAMRKTRGRNSTKYESISDSSVTIKKKEYDALSDEDKGKYRPVSKTSKQLVSYSGVFGDNYPQRKQYMKDFHTQYHDEVGVHFGLERGDDLDLLDPEERRKRRHMRKEQLHAVQEYDRKLAELGEKQKAKEDDLRDKEESVRKVDAQIEQKNKNFLIAGIVGAVARYKIQEEGRNLPSLKELTERETRNKAVPSLQEIINRENRDKAVPSLQDIIEREKRDKAVPSLSNIINRENRDKIAPSLQDITNREKRFKEVNDGMKKLLRMALDQANKNNEGDDIANSAYSSIDDLSWYNTAYFFIDKRNKKLAKEAEQSEQKKKKLEKNIEGLNGQIASLTQKQKIIEGQICETRKSAYRGLILPNPDGVKVTNIRVYDDKGAKKVGITLDGTNYGAVLDESQIKDFNDKVASAGDLAALLLTSTVQNYGREKEQTQAKKKMKDSWIDHYKGFSLPLVDGKIPNVQLVNKGDGKSLYVQLGGKWYGTDLTKKEIQDLNDNLATKEQLAAVHFSEKVFGFIKTQKQADIDAMHVPTAEEAKEAKDSLEKTQKAIEVNKTTIASLDEDIKDRKKKLESLHVPTDEEIKNGKREWYAGFEQHSDDIIVDAHVSKSMGGDICVFAKVNNEALPHGIKLSEKQYQDYSDGIITANQLAWLIMPNKILDKATRQKQEALNDINSEIQEAKNNPAEVSLLNKKAVSILGSFGEMIKDIVQRLNDWVLQRYPKVTAGDANNIHIILGMMVQTGQAKDRIESADKLCDIAIPVNEKSTLYSSDSRWRNDVVEIVRSIAEQGTQIDLEQEQRRSKGLGI
jgi:hypothetical protein